MAENAALWEMMTVGKELNTLRKKKNIIRISSTKWDEVSYLLTDDAFDELFPFEPNETEIVENDLGKFLSRIVRIDGIAFQNIKSMEGKNESV